MGQPGTACRWYSCSHETDHQMALQRRRLAGGGLSLFWRGGDQLHRRLVAAAVLGALNTVVRPILVLLTLPVTLVTVGLFLFVINALMFWRLPAWSVA